MSMPDRETLYAEQIAKLFIDGLSEETPTYRNPWVEGKGPTPFGQYNPLSGKQYRGSNQMLLTMIAIDKDYDDDRWLTFKQGAALGARVRKGERGVLVRYYKEETKEVENDQGEKETLTRGRMYFANVFNACQFDGLPLRPERDFSRTADMMHAEAQAVVDRLGVPVFHDTRRRAYYDLTKDEIHLPPMDQFRSKGDAWATLLHECAHATGHPSRLNRDMRSSKDDMSIYAREELRAEVASLMIGQRCGVHAEIGQHKAYVKHWVQILTEKPTEILKACADAEKICFHLGVHAPEHERLLPKEQSPAEKARLEQGVAEIKKIEEESQKRARTRERRVRAARTQKKIPAPELSQSQSR